MHDLISEFTLLKDISHPNVIKLLGASTEKGKTSEILTTIIRKYS